MIKITKKREPRKLLEYRRLPGASYENMDRLCEALECTIADLLECEPIQHKLNLRDIV